MALKKTKKGFYVLEKFTKFPELIHGFSTKEFGNMKIDSEEEKENVLKNRKKFAQAVGFDSRKIVETGQVHGTKIAIVGKKDLGKQIKGTDGLLTRDQDVLLLVKTADCVPILFYDPVQKVVGIAHAGWKGILGKIDSKLVELMQTEFNCDAGHILVGLGPSIGDCCYVVSKERALKFKHFGKGVIWAREGKWHLDLKKAVYKDLVQAGLLPSNIEVSDICTSCQNKDFFSYRKEGENLAGEIAAVIGMRVGP